MRVDYFLVLFCLISLPVLIVVSSHCLAELTEFVLQLDEEVEGMPGTVLHLDLQVKDSQLMGASSSSPAPKDTSNSSSKGSKERTKVTSNGPVDSGSIDSCNPSNKT